MDGGARSDQLADLHQLAHNSGSPLALLLSPIVRAKIIIDANVAYRDILWMARDRQNPNAKRYIHEISNTSVAEIHAPSFLQKEIEKYFPELAEKSKKPVEEVEAIWTEYSAHIQFHDTSNLPSFEGTNTERDPKDLPYLQLQQHLNHPILTDDKDISGMGGKTVELVVIQRLRDLYRINAVEYQVAIVGYGLLVFGSMSIMGLINLLKTGIHKLFNLPDWAYPLIAIGLIIIFKDSKLKAKFSVWIDVLVAFIPDLTEELIHHTGNALSMYQEAKTKGAELLKELPDDLKPIT